MSPQDSPFGDSISAAAGAAIGTAVGTAVVEVVSEFGKRLSIYWTPSPMSAAIPADGKAIPLVQLPPYAIVGVGRCGSHVSVELANMLRSSSESHEKTGQTRAGGWFSAIVRMFGGERESQIRAPKPMLIIGDIDETTLTDVGSMFTIETRLGSPSDMLRRLDYRPLAQGGAGHVPAFGEFLTRGLLLLAPQSEQGDEKMPWAEAREYLIDICAAGTRAPRLVFYIFSAGGGTGSGAAAELVRAQRVAMNMTPTPDPEIYLTGVTVVPRDLLSAKNRRHLINTGRLFVQYLADLNIRLEQSSDYQDAQEYRYSNFTVSTDKTRSPVRPWDSLGVVSNEVMRGFADQSREKAEVLANRYIAQQVFSLAASQVRYEGHKNGHAPQSELGNERFQDLDVGSLNFRSIRLDPHDLKTSLRGPYAIGFGTATKKALRTNTSADAMFLRALSIPRQEFPKSGGEEESVPDVISGISVLPAEAGAYDAIMTKLFEKLNEKNSELTRLDFEQLAALPIFARCPRVVFVVTEPEDADHKDSFPHRISELIAWAMPRLNEARYAIVRHPTSYFALSIFMQSSVVLAPEIEKSIRNYVKLCWAQRNATKGDFTRDFDTFLKCDPPLDTKAIEEWLGPLEQYHKNIDDFGTTLQELQQRWDRFVVDRVSLVDQRKKLTGHRVEDCMLKSGEVAAAIRFMNYVARLELPEIV